jgi:carbon storage regulator
MLLLRRVFRRTNRRRPPRSSGFSRYNGINQDPKLRTKEGSDMLVLSRKLGEKIQIGEDICVTVVDIDRGKIRLGIEAPREVPIFRQELLPLGVSPTRDEPAALLVH